MWSALIFCTVYQSYRYPLQINSSGTSPTYSDTPVSLQIAKVLIGLFFCLVGCFYIPRRTLSLGRWALVGLAASMSMYPLLKAFGAEAGDKSVYLDVSFWSLAPLLLALSVNSITFEDMDKFFRVIFFYAIASTVVEVLLFLTVGRLPALAYSGSFSVRFGGFLDDPNGFAAVLIMLMGWAYFHFSGGRRWLVEGTLVLCLLLTQSLTAIGYFIALTLAIGTVLFIKRPRPLLLMATIATVSVALVCAWSRLTKLAELIAGIRGGSADAHLSQLNGIQAASFIDWIIGSPSYQPFESWWLGALVNFGVPWSALTFSITLALALFALRRFFQAPCRIEKAVLGATLMLSCYFVLGSFNLPYFRIFPVNFIFFFLGYLVCLGKFQPKSKLIEG